MEIKLLKGTSRSESKQKAYLLKIGENIKQLRISKKISQVELAYRCNFEKTNLCRIESGNTNPTIKTLLIIAEALEVNLLDILAP